MLTSIKVHNSGPKGGIGMHSDEYILVSTDGTDITGHLAGDR